MPPEVLSNIFKLGKSLCEDEVEDEEVDISQKSMPFEILVSHVNSHFRKIALNTKVLWSSIRIASDKSVSEIETYLERSGTSKLDVQMTLSHTSLQKTHRMIRLILPHSPRWRTFYYRSVYEVQGGIVLSYLSDMVAPMLEELSLTIDEMASNSDASNPKSILIKGAPMLLFVRLRGFAIYSLLPPLCTARILHLDQTKSFALRNPAFQHVVSTPQCLEHLSIYGDMVADSSWPGAEDIIRFPKLISLRIYDVRGWAYAGLLLGFDAPVLNALTMKGVLDHDLDRLWSIGDPSRFSNLQSLTFWDFGLLACEWGHVFRLFCGITSFSSYSSKYKSTMMLLLAGSDTNPLPWPFLKSLSFIFDDEDEDEEKFLEDIITSRSIRGHPLDVIRLGTSEDGHDFRSNSLMCSTKIEYFRSLDRWPLDRGFRDWDDNLFL